MFSDYILPLTIVGVTAVVALLVQVLVKVFERVARSRADTRGINLALALARALDGPVTLMVIVWGGSEAIAESLQIWQAGRGLPIDLSAVARRAGNVAMIIIGAYIANQVVRSALANIQTSIAAHTETSVDDRVIPVARHVMPILVYTVAGLLILNALNIAITPLLATLGIGGIAVALAAQSTLSNYFAGTYVISEGEIGVGDFIEIEGGPSGTVQEISWRSTKLQSRFNNLIIIPNSMMSENMITNYSRPVQAQNVMLAGGVSYDEDLEQVESVLRAAVDDVVVDSEYAVTDSEPMVGFNAFGDSNIDFWVFAQAVDRIGSYYLESQLIKEIHKRFKAADIVINYPVRHLVWDDDRKFPVSADANASDTAKPESK